MRQALGASPPLSLPLCFSLSPCLPLSLYYSAGQGLHQVTCQALVIPNHRSFSFPEKIKSKRTKDGIYSQISNIHNVGNFLKERRRIDSIGEGKTRQFCKGKKANHK